MLKLHTIGLAAFNASIAAWEKAVEGELEALARGLAAEALVTLLYHSPQYSGDFAANWKLSYGSVDNSFEAAVLGKTWPDPEPYLQGDLAAISKAWSEAKGKMTGFKLGDTIFITNSAKHTETYAWMIEGNKIRFRTGNSGEPVRITMEEMAARFKTISKQTAARLTVAKL